MHVRCPHCHNPIEVVDDVVLSNIDCPSCGSSFSLVGDSQKTRHWSQKETNGETLGASQSAQQQIAHFRILEKLGTGAFGSVWKAADTQLDRTVAIKIPRKGQLSAAESEQFLREARAAAQLKHPNIVTVHEVGREDGQVYIVSDFVAGTTLANRIEADRLSPREAAELIAKVADALHHAHNFGVIHRDLKPANIMLDEKDQPHVMDFGLAKRETGEITMTVEGKILGTPAYMSPEQARGDAHRADARSDVYSLGVILFELLTGEKPFRGDVRILLDQVLREDAPSPRKMNPRLDRELETICLKCLEKEPAARYQTADEMAQELRRHLHGEPIHARPITNIARAWRWCNRNRLVAGLMASVTGLLLLAAVAGPIIGWRERVLRSKERNAKQLAQQRAKRIERQERETRRQLYVAHMRLGKQYLDSGRINLVSALLEQHIPQDAQEDLRAFDWYYLWRNTHPNVVRLPHRGEIRAIAYSPSGKLLLTGDATGRLMLWETTSRRKIASFVAHNAAIAQIAFAPSSRFFATAGWDDLVKVWSTDSFDKPVAVLSGHKANLRCVAFSPDESQLVSGDNNGTLKVWNSENWQLQQTIDRVHQGRILGVAFSPNGETLYTCGSDGLVKEWNLPAEKPVHTTQAHRGEIFSLAVSSDGRWMGTGSTDGTAKIWDTMTREVKKTIKSSAGQMFPQDFSSATNLWAVMTRRQIQVWRLETMKRQATLQGHASAQYSLKFSPNGRYLAAGTAGDAVKLWQTPQQDEVRSLRGHKGRIFSLAMSSDSRLVATAGENKIIVWDLDRVAENVSLETDIPARSVHFSTDGRLLAGAVMGCVQLWSLPDGERKLKLVVEKPDNEPNSVAHITSQARFSPDGSIMAVGYYDGAVRLWDVAAGKVLAVLENDAQPKSHEAPEIYAISALAFSPDGKLLIVGGRKGRLALWKIAGRKRLGVVDAHRYVDAVAFSSDGQLLASVGRGGSIKLWDPALLKLERELSGARGGAFVGFTPDGKRVYSGGADGVKFWDLATGEELLGIGRRSVAPSDAAITSDGNLLVSCGWDGIVRLWRAADQSDVERWFANTFAP